MSETSAPRGLDAIATLEKLNDGSTLVLEEAQRGRHRLTFVSLRRYPPTMNADSILSTLDPNAVRDREHGLKIVQRPVEGKTILYHRQAGKPADPLMRQHGRNSEQSRRRGRDQLARQGKQSR